ncbi:LCP family protein [Curtobacterium sp. RHCJP20]|uniref:LCP family protein n=1 Tax=Curtobacterium subtropicum TaxID=3055138 RepID=A0ABT7TF07_9MICO|nr:LCP family protein [Curtobacterium subtropicum]MDM7888157.1 LCP family protein [Curtobacterium subtropicum]
MSERRAARAAAEAAAVEARAAAEAAAVEARAAAKRTRAAARRKRPVLVALLSTLGALAGVATVLAVVAAVFVGSLARSFDTRTETIADPFPAGDRPTPAGAAENVLLIGSDSRAGLDPDGDHTAGGRSDTLMLAHVPADRRHVYLMSIMRDAWVDVPGHGQAKVNAAYAWGGIPLTVQTVEQLLDVRIDHVAEIDLAGFEDVTDALGGVTVQSPQDFDARGHHFVRGANRLDGEQALAFVRERHAFADADHTRVRNQQAFLRGVFDQVVSRGTLTDPGRLQEFVAATSEHLAVDPGLDAATIARLGWSLRGIRPDDLVTFTMPTAGGGTAPDGQSFVRLAEHDRSAISAALRSDDLQHWLDDRPR